MDDETKRKARVLLKLFKIDGKPADQVASDGQVEIFHSIISKKWDRVEIISSTQYGKSLFVAFGCIILSCIEGEIVSIIAPTNEKARIIMRYYVSHLGDHSLFHSQLEKGSSLEKLQMETTKERIVLKNGGGVFTLSVQAGNTKKGFEAAMGEGSKIVIQDESALIPNEIEATVFRMIAGKKDAVYVKIGNPFYRNHFYKSSKDPAYHQIFINDEQGLREGRYTQAFLEEAKGKPLYDVLFRCKFPDDSTVDIDGYTRLLTESEYLNALTDFSIHSNIKILGVDPAAGGDNSSIVLKSANLQEVMFNQQLKDTSSFANIVIGLYHEHACSMIVVDKSGIGQGVYDILYNNDLPVKGISFGETADNESHFNLKAELYWKQRAWVLKGGKFKRNQGFNEFEDIKYKVRNGKIFIQPKEELYRSPNVVDACVLTQYVKEQEIRNRKIIASRQGTFYDKNVEIWRG